MIKRLAISIFVAALFVGSSPALANPQPDLVRAAIACALASTGKSFDPNSLTKDGWHLETLNPVAKAYASRLGLTAYGRGTSTANVLAGSFEGAPACLAMAPIPASTTNDDYAATVLNILKPEKTVRDGTDYILKKLGRVFVLNLPDNGSERVAVIRVLKRN